MKVATRVVAVLMVLAAASVANANTQVWFTASATGAAGNGATGQPVGGGIPGSSTTLTCLSTAAFCEWSITANFANAGADAPLAGWANDLFATGAGGKLIVITASTVYPGTGFPQHPVPLEEHASPGMISRSDGLDLGNGQSSGVLVTFTLRKVKQGSGSLNTETIHLIVGPSEWADVNGNYPVMQAGGNGAVVDGGAAGTDLGTVITITNIPEPATVSLLGLGALALIRRRR